MCLESSEKEMNKSGKTATVQLEFNQPFLLSRLQNSRAKQKDGRKPFKDDFRTVSEHETLKALRMYKN